MSRLVHEKIRHYEICELGKETDNAAELHKRRAAECAGAEASLMEFAEKRLQRVFEKVKAELDSDALTVDEATKIRTYLSLALSEANGMRRTIAQQKLREEGAAAVLGSMKLRLEKKRDNANEAIDAMAAHEAAQSEDPDRSIGGVFRGGIMAQRRAERLAEEAADREPAAPEPSDAEEKNHAPEGSGLSQECHPSTVDETQPVELKPDSRADEPVDVELMSDAGSSALQMFSAKVASQTKATPVSSGTTASKKGGQKKAKCRKSATAPADDEQGKVASQAARRALSAKARARRSEKLDGAKATEAQA